MQYAHTTDGPEETWECLDAHLQRVASHADRQAAKFGAEAFGRAAGLLHDLGKAKPEFQAFISVSVAVGPRFLNC